MSLNLKERQGLESMMNSLVRRAQKLLDRKGMERSGLEKSQLNNLLSVALETTSVEVVKNFILYQVGRDDKRRSWRYQDFGQELVREIDRLRNDIAKQVAVRALNRPSEREIDKIWIHVVRQYLGQLHRYFYYLKGK